MNESRDEMIKGVRLEIEEAFADVPMPEASKIVVETADSPYYARALAEALANRPRHMVDEDFLKGWYFPVHYLTPEAYYYYFPAILTHGLEPDYVELCATGRDATHQYQTSLFSEEQYKLACSFVELWFEVNSFDRASSLFWRWNRYEHPALERARAFYQKMRNFEYPASAEPEINALIHQILTAFDTAPYPDDEICTHLYDPEAAQSAVEFRGVNWRTLHPDFLGREDGALCFFTDKAFRHFLPAYLIADLMRWDLDNEITYFEVDSVFELTRGLVPQNSQEDSEKTAEAENLRLYVQGLDESMARLYDEQLAELDRAEASRSESARFEDAAKRFSLFNQPERDAIIAFLRHRAQESEFWTEDIDIALERYWLKPLS